MKKKVLSYVALSSALLTAAPLLGNVTANAATTNDNSISSSAKVSSSSSSDKENSRVSTTSSSKVADKKAARSAVRENNFAEVSLTNNNVKAQSLFVKPADATKYINGVEHNVTYDAQIEYKDGSLPSVQAALRSLIGDDAIAAFENNPQIVSNVYGNGFKLEDTPASAGPAGAKNEGLYYNGKFFTGFDAQDGVFWYKGQPITLAELEQAGVKIPQNIINAMKQAEANKVNANKVNNGTARLANGQTIRTYGYNHYVANVNARTLPKTGESNSIVSLLKALF